ncbi:hypothetical protein D9619_010017 [Psilocybe cf. subviscida]|uniref:DUF4139 domain-containing protein n=1 Tax=Psilocybe cf. subviscida TaxID=2480587 RepID=A0A8H5F629_9AGAR|nr:hypothetical protein D9619_010017 [Psilocybe cf. subviscida]
MKLLKKSEGFFFLPTTMTMDSETNLSVLHADARADAKIKTVHLYPSQAQITRALSIDAVAGASRVIISHLPTVLDGESLRVRCIGNGTITDVSSTLLSRQSTVSSPRLAELNVKLSNLTHTLNRAQTVSSTIHNYVQGVDFEHLDISKLSDTMDIYDAAEEKWDVKLVELELEIEALKEQIAEEEDTLRKENKRKKLARMEVTVNIITASAQRLDLELEYSCIVADRTAVVTQTSWTPAYDIRVDLQTPPQPVKFVYRAMIRQQTGEDWNNVILFLGTAAPLFVNPLPKIDTWHVMEKAPLVRTRKSRLRRSSRFLDVEAEVSDEDEDEEDEAEDLIQLDESDEYTAAPLAITSVRSSLGGVTATFEVSKPVTVRCTEGDATHDIVIAELELDAQMAWMCIPKRDSSVFLSATIMNSSEYTFLPGNCSSFVDGTYVSKCFLPRVCPQETFECNLGPDPSVHTSYQTLPPKVSQSGYITTTRTHDITHRVRVHNAKPAPLQGIRVIDHVPVSNDARIVVKVIQPGLTVPSMDRTAHATSPDVIVGEGIVARWLIDNRHYKDGGFEWICDVPANGTVDLVVQCQISSPIDIVLDGV